MKITGEAFEAVVIYATVEASVVAIIVSNAEFCGPKQQADQPDQESPQPVSVDVEYDEDDDLPF